MLRNSMLAILLLSAASPAQVTLHPGDNIPKTVASKPPGTTFVFTPGTYRLSQPIIPKENDKFVGATACEPPESACPAIISGGVVIGSLARADGGNYSVPNQTQHNPRGVTTRNCDDGWLACIYPEDLYFDGVPYRHLDSQTLPAIGPHEWWFDYTNHIIYFHDDPAGHTVETSVLNYAFGGASNHVTIQYLTIQEFANMYPAGAIGVSHGPEALTQGTDWTVQHCEVRLNHGAGVRIGYRMRILNNYIHDNGQLGIGGGLGVPSDPLTESTNAGILIQGNTINHNDYAHFAPGFGAGGFKVGSTSGITLRQNKIEHNEGSGIHFDEDSQNEFVDGNVIIDNSDGDALVQEIGEGRSVFRNNIVLRNGAHVNTDNWAYQISVRSSTGVEIYCNVMEVPAADKGVGAWGIGASPRGSSKYPPFAYHATIGNYVHHNTIIFDPGANGEVGFRHNDPQNQPGFFGDNPAPDYNSYYIPKNAQAHFIYDNDNSRSNRGKNFGGHQASHADIHGSLDTHYPDSFPTVSITSPADQSSVTAPATIAAAASDSSGIRKIEFYVDWKLRSTVKDGPYNFTWDDPTSGPHTIAAMAYSNAGVHACYAITLNGQ
jgi:hypothetical protein